MTKFFATPLRRPDFPVEVLDPDPVWYLQTYTDVAEAGMDAGEHYRIFGWKEGRWPHRPLAPSLEEDLWRGQAQDALPRLKEMAQAPSSPDADYALWALGRWYATAEEWPTALPYLSAFLLRPFGPPVVSGLGPELLLLEALHQVRGRRPARTQLRKLLKHHGTHPELTLACLLLQPRHRRISTLARLYREASLQPVSKAQGQKAGIDGLVVKSSKPQRAATAREENATEGSHRSSPSSCPQSTAPGTRFSARRLRITVLLPFRDAADTLATALRSLTTQTYQHLEIVAIDDGSTDGSTELVQKAAEEDPRIRLLLADGPGGQGPYPARNQGLREATGDLITVHDADDWSHPQKLAQQVDALRRHPQARASVSHWVRMTPDLRPQKWRMDEGRIHRNISSLLFPREVLNKLGYWDRVRVEADTEYYHRMRRVYGEDCVVEALPGIPLAFGRHHPESLTQHSATHLRTQFHGLRRDYREAADRWHARSSPEELYLPEFPKRRPFDIPDAIGLGDPPADLLPEDKIRRSPWLDADWYLATYEPVRREYWDAARHYYEIGADLDYDPGPNFSTASYRRKHNLPRQTNPVLHALGEPSEMG